MFFYDAHARARLSRALHARSLALADSKAEGLVLPSPSLSSGRYQRGLGVRRDFHLAKRHFDLAAESAPEAAWPARLALGLLYLEVSGRALRACLRALPLSPPLSSSSRG